MYMMNYFIDLTMKFIDIVYYYIIITFSHSLFITGSETCDSGKGICIDTNSQTCSNGILIQGYCPGGSNILCCESTVSCDSGKGICMDSSLQTCEGIFKAGYCPENSNILCCEPFPEICSGSGPPLPSSSYLFTLKNQGFDGHPGALVYIPSNFNTSSKDLDIVIYVHGFYNCISNIIRDSSSACNCSVGSDIRQSYNLINQFENAALNYSQSNPSKEKNWLFVAAEVAYDQANSNPGRWAESGLFKAYIDELLTTYLPTIEDGNQYNHYSVDTVSRIRIFSHSGGYNVIADMATIGGINDKVHNLVLFDSLYGSIDKFETYIKSHLELCDVGTNYSQYRFDSVYTESGGTYDNNNAMASLVSDWVQDTQDQCSNTVTNTRLWYNNNGSDSLDIDTIRDYSLLFQLTDYAHDDVPKQMFYDFLIATA